jgi:solute carrier family 25 oxoglutarate transporter 11
MTQESTSSTFSKIRPFLFGGFSGMFATCCIQPIDTVKVRIQIMGENLSKGSTNPLAVGRKILAEEGVRSLYRGLDSALMRQATYTTTRLGVYRTLFNKREAHYGGSIPFYEKVVISMSAGFIGSIIGNPSDLALVRFQSDQTMPKEMRRNYKHVFDAFGRIVKEEGLFSLWKGSTPTIVRAMSLNAGQLATFEELKEQAAKFRGKDDIGNRIIGVIGSGIAASCVSLPFDNIKTKLQKQKPGSDGVLPYKGFIDCMKITIAREGVTGLWIGLPTFIIRIAPHSIISLLIMDYLHTTFGAGAKKKK